MDIKFRSGKTNKCADALSRRRVEIGEIVETATNCTPIPSEVHTAKKSQGPKTPPIEAADVLSSVLPSFSHAELALLQKEDVQLCEVWRRWDSKWQPGMPETNKVPGIGGWVREWSRIVERRGVLYRQIEDKVHSALFQMLTPVKLQKLMLEGAHDNWGHQGTNRTLALLRSRCFWPGISRRVRDYVHNCFKCTVSKTPSPTVKPPMRHLLSFKPMECLAIDFLKLDRGRDGYEDVLVMTDAFTKYACAVPCKNQTAVVVARALRDHWFSHYGIPMRIHSDQGRNFEGKLVGEFCQLYGIKKTRTSPYHPQGNAQTERFNKTLCFLVKSMDVRDRKNWPQMLPHLVFVYNSTPRSVTGVTPYTLLFGRQPTVTLDHLVGNAGQEFCEDFVQQQAGLIERMSRVVRDRLERAAGYNKQRYDEHCRGEPFKVGDRVLVKKCAFTHRHKLSDVFHHEPHVVLKCNKEKDLYAVRPVLGGESKWLNRKLLVLDPRGNFSELDEPRQLLPDPGSQSDLESSEKDDMPETEFSSSDEELVVIPANLFPPQIPQKKASSPRTTGAPTAALSETDDRHSEDPPLRWSRRLASKRKSGWQSAIT